jgi:hypothetical protein
MRASDDAVEDSGGPAAASDSALVPRERDWRWPSDWSLEVVAALATLVAMLLIVIYLATSDATADRVLVGFAAIAAIGVVISLAATAPSRRDDEVLRAQQQSEAHLARIAELLGEAAAQSQALQRAELREPPRRRPSRRAVGLIALSLLIVLLRRSSDSSG